MKKTMVALLVVPLLLLSGCTEDAYNSGYSAGYNEAKEEYSLSQFDEGYDSGYEIGQDNGYSEGFADCFARMMDMMPQAAREQWAKDNVDLLVTDMDFNYAYYRYLQE